MKLSLTTSYEHILYILTSGDLLECAISDFSMSVPQFKYESFSGYIEVNAIFIIKNLQIFNNIYTAFYSLTDTQRLNLYGLAKGLGDRK